jgi:Zinc knuckle
MAIDHTVGYLALVREFDGKSSGISVNEFLYQVNEVGQLCNWDDSKKILIARLKMTGLARIFRDHTDHFQDIYDWADFCNTLKARFIPVSSENAKLVKYLNASQQSSETIFNFATRLSMLFDRAKPPPAAASVADLAARLVYKSKEIKALFVRGLKDKKLALRVMDQNPSTLQDTIKLASQLDANNFEFNKIHFNLIPLSGVNKEKNLKLKSRQTPVNSYDGLTAAFGPSGTNTATFSHSQIKPSSFSKNNTHDSRGGFHSDFSRPWRDFSRGRHYHNPCDSRPHGAYSHPLSGRAPQAQRNHTHEKFTSCYICGAANHYANGCARYVSMKNNTNFKGCYKCGAADHFANACTQHLSKKKKI